jgi:EAL domain-containing protein (putative c-di-GMP-specific phosphodiesterase class I)
MSLYSDVCEWLILNCIRMMHHWTEKANRWRFGLWPDLAENAFRKRDVLEGQTMANNPLMISIAIVALVVTGVTSATFLAGTGFGIAALTGSLSGALTLCAIQLRQNHHKNNLIKISMDELQSQFVYLHERQGQAESRLQGMIARTIDSPSLALHATATDIDVLGSLVRDLAQTVAEHDGKLAEYKRSDDARAQDLRTEQVRGAPHSRPLSSLAQSVQPALSRPIAPLSTSPLSTSPLSAPSLSVPRKPVIPQDFEADAELGFTADLPQSVLSESGLSRSVAAQQVRGVPAAALRASVAESAVEPSPAVLAELKSTLSAAIAGNHLELCLQPIVILPQRKARGYEASVVLKGDRTDGHAGTDLRRIAVATGLQKEFDRTLFAQTTQISRILRARKREVAMCCAVSMESFSDPEFRSMIEDLVRNDSKLARSILLEIDDADFKAAGALGKERLAALAKLGIGLGLSLRGSLRFHAPDLVASGIRQLRVPASLMQTAAQTGGDIADIHPADVAELLQRNGIDLLVSDVGDENTVREMLDFAAPFAQGDLFGKARTVRPEVLEPKSVGSGPVGSARARMATAAAEEMAPAGRNIPRQSFRSLLRRA